MSMNTASSDSSGGNTTANTSLRPLPPPSRYESQKRRDWNTFGQYLKNHRPPLTLSRCSGAHVLEFLRYLDQFGKTKVHLHGCPFFGHPNPPAPCPCPLRQAWGSLDALVGRLRAAFEENGGQPETNPFGARAVRLYLREVRDAQSKARGIAYEKKKRKKPPPPPPPPSQQQQLLPGPSSVPPPPSNLQLTDLNTSVAGSYLPHQVSHSHGHHLFFSDGDAYSGVGSSSNDTNPGGGVANRTGVSPFGGPDERLLLFHCSSGSLG